MSHIDAQITFQLGLTSREFSLVSRSLNGTLPAKEQREAAELSVRITEQIARQLQQRSEVSTGAARKAREVLDAMPPEEPEEPPNGSGASLRVESSSTKDAP